MGFRKSHIRFNVCQIFYQTKTATLTNGVAETITTTAITWIIKNLTNPNKVMIKQYIKIYTLFMQELAERIWYLEDKIGRRKYINKELKRSVYKESILNSYL